MATNVRYTYVRNRQGMPVGCLAFQFDRTTGLVQYGWSAQNPIDEWDRKDARLYAVERLAHRPENFKLTPEVSLRDVLINLRSVVRKNETIPNRLRRPLNQEFRSYTKS